MISVLVVEDDEVAGEAHETCANSVAGFRVVGRVRTGQEALRFLTHTAVDLVLLDLRLPDMDGLRVSRMLRTRGSGTDVIAVTSARDLDRVRESVSSGVVQYLLKPFTFVAMREKLRNYARFRGELSRGGAVNGQHEIDRVFATLRDNERQELPKGMDEQTLTSVAAALRESGDGASAGKVGKLAGVSRVTARRYLEYLVERDMARRSPRHGGVGRPELIYRADLDDTGGAVP
ncbi:Response regulator of citrate/malate metabolism [Actinopolyspora alba]|uniref:Transcriptional regulatory protein n=1 Tax=Actinopolyspora alba TaxID=673379 RepID=A0A1I1VAE5_9ACTN|nr:response regulator [Actinopolyspora alba]SFD78938.1 Response regulator of citrate/malate metabolism [Actinopolyspora alba]